MEPQCSCSACSSLACLARRPHVPYFYSTKRTSKTYLYFNKIDKNISTFSLDDFKLGRRNNSGYEDKKLSVDSGILTETPQISCEDSVKSTRDNFSHMTSSYVNTLRPSAAKLSAQIMNVPLKDLEDSFRLYESAPRTDIAKLTPFDIFEKIKDVYKACSCKVCECIVGKSQKNEICDCKPCDCDDCKTYKRKVTISNNFTSLDVVQATSDCLRLEESLFKRFASKELKQDCDCKPCQCADCVKILSSPRSCEQGRCMECKTRYTRNKYQKLVVAAVESDNQSRQDCLCNPCNCAECHYRQELTATMQHEMSTETSTPETCRCETCLNEACAPDGLDACSCERRSRVMRKPTQRDTDYDIHRSLVTQQNPCRQDLIAMFAAISKIFPYVPVRKCNCGHCDCWFCNCKSKKAAKTSEIPVSDNESNTHDTVKSSVKSPSLNYEFVPKKSLKINEFTPKCKNLDRSSEIKSISKFSSNNTCRCSLYECINDDNMMSTCTGDVCDCTQCKCERCVSKDDVIYPIKRGEKLTPSNFKNKMSTSAITFSDDISDEDHKIPQKQPRYISSGTNYDKVNSPINDDVGDECSHINNPHVEQEFYQKVNTRFNKVHRVEPFTDTSKLKRTFNRSASVKFQATSSKLVADFPVSIGTNSESNPQLTKKYQNKNLNTSDHNDFKYPISYPKKRTAYLNNFDTFNKFTDIKRPRLNIVPTHNLKISNVHSHTDKEFLRIKTKPYKFSKEMKKQPSCGKSYVEKTNESVTVSSQCMIGGKSSIANKIDITTKVNEGKLSTNSKIKLTKSEDYKRAAYYSKSNSQVGSTISKNVADAATHDFDRDEDYKRVQKTIRDARNFSLHLMNLLEKYETANREFESIYQKLAHSNNTFMVHHLVSVPQNIPCINAGTENNRNNCFPKPYFNNMATQVTNLSASTLTVENNQYHRASKDERSKIRSKSIQSSNSLNGNINITISDEEMKSLAYSSKQRAHEYSEEMHESFGSIEHKHISDENVYDLCNNANDDAEIEFRHDSSNTFSFNNSDFVDDYVNYEDKLLPISEANNPTTPFNMTVKKRNMKKKSRRYYSKMYKQAVIVSKRRNCFVPTFAKCSITTETSSNNIADEINENYHEFDVILQDDESKLSGLISESVGDENGYAETDDSTTMNTADNVDDSLPQSSIQINNIAEHRDVKLIESPKPLEAENSKTKKVFGRTSESEAAFEVIRKHSLGKGIKEAVNAIKQASLTWESNYAKTRQDNGGRHENVALKKLHFEVKKLLEMPLLQNCDFEQDQSQSNHEKCESNCVHKCESMKVSCVTARKLPDDTVVVKWQVPSSLENVQGYEVLVNGKSVQKIQDKTCDKSILSGLQESDKYLVMIRTVTKRQCSAGRCLTATTVYRPWPSAVCCN